MLGTEFAGVLSSDDFSVYNGCHVTAQQKCLAHLLRHFKKVLALPDQNNNVAVAAVFIELINEAFGQHRLWREEGYLVTYFQWAEVIYYGINSRGRSTSTPLGQVLRLPCKFIQGKYSTEVMVINAIAAELAISGKIDPATIAQAIIKYRSADRINNLTFLTKLKCGIGKTKLPGLVDRLVYYISCVR